MDWREKIKIKTLNLIVQMVYLISILYIFNYYEIDNYRADLR